MLESAEDTAEHNGSVEKITSTKDQGLVCAKSKSEKSVGSKKSKKLRTSHGQDENQDDLPVDFPAEPRSHKRTVEHRNERPNEDKFASYFQQTKAKAPPITPPPPLVGR